MNEANSNLPDHVISAINTIIDGVREVISDNIEIISSVKGSANPVFAFLDQLQTAPDRSKMFYIMNVVYHIQHPTVTLPEEQTWIKDFFNGDCLENLVKHPELVPLFAVIGISPRYLITDKDSPVIKLRIKLAEEYNNAVCLRLTNPN